MHTGPEIGGCKPVVVTFEDFKDREDVLRSYLPDCVVVSWCFFEQEGRDAEGKQHQHHRRHVKVKFEQEKMFYSTTTKMWYHTPDKKKCFTPNEPKWDIIFQTSKMFHSTRTKTWYHIPDECEKRGLNSESLSASQKRFLREFSSQKSSHINHSKKQIKLGNFFNQANPSVSCHLQYDKAYVNRRSFISVNAGSCCER